MPIGSTNVYNPGDLILSTVSGSGTSFIETKIAAATSSLILFNSNGTLTSASLNSTTVGTSSYVSGSTSIITSITASAISASGQIQANQLTASSILANNGPLMVTGSNAYIQMFPVGGFPLPTNLTASYIYTSGSTNDLYFTQYNGPYTNTTRLRWLESNLYTGILHGGVLTSTPGSTTFTVTEGEGLIVSLNAFTASAPYPTVKLISWPTSTQPITYSGSAKITYVGINDVGGIVQQTNAWGSSDINQWDNQIELGVVLHLSGSVSTGVFNSPQISYGIPQQTDDFLRAFGPLKVSGHTLQASGSSPTLSIKKSGGTAYREGANYVNNPNHPSTVVENAINTSKIYRYYLSGSTPIIDTGVANAGYSTIDNDNYVDTTTGLLATVGNSNWTIQRVFWIPNSPTNAFIVYYGNATYSTLLNAVNAKDSEPFTEAPNTALNAIFVGYIVIEGGAGRDLLNAVECTIIQGGLFRNVGGVGSSGTTPVSTTLAGLSDVALSGLAAGDLLVYGGGQWNNNKTLDGNYIVSGSLTVQSGITGNLTGTSSWASNARTASYLTPSNSYTITNLTASTISASGAIIASSFTGSFSGSIGTAVNATSASYALTSSYISPSGNAFVQSGNSFGTTALLGTNDAQSLALETNGTTRMTINSAGFIGVNTSPTLDKRFNISDTHNGSLGSSSLYIATGQNQNQGLATSTNDSGINNVYSVNNFTSSAAIQNQAIYNQTIIAGSGSFSGSYRAERNAILLSNTALLDINGNIINTYLTNQISSNIPTFSINNWIAGTQTYVDLTPNYNSTGSITNLYQHQIGSPFPSGGAGGITVTNSYGIYIAKQKTTNIVTNGWGIYQADTGDLNIFAGKTRIGSTTVPVNTLDVTGNISASVVTASLFFGTASFATTAQTANALNTANSYTIAGLTNNGTLSQQGTLSMGSGYQLLLTTGTAPVPSLSFVGDTNTGIYSPSADTIGFSISGSERVTINNSGSVGIGTTSPNQRLEVNTGTVTNGLGARIGEARIGSWISDGNYAVFSHNTVADTTNSYCLLHRSTGEVYLNAAASQVIHFRSNNVDTWAIYSTGVLESNGAQTIQTSTGNLKLATAAGDGHILLTPNGNGNVGIGTTLPIAIVDVQGTNVTLYAANYVGSLGTMYLRGNDAYNSGTAGAGIYLRGKYDSSSNVTTFGAISAIKENNIDGNYAGALTFLSRTNGQGSGAAEKMRIDSNGNVGIGTTSPAARLEISGSSNSALFNIKSAISGNIIFVTGSGCVGINKSTPTATFDISGSVLITGSLNVTTNVTCLSLTETSTEAVKYNIIPLPSQLDNVLKLKPVSFNYKTNDKHSIGLIAEEVAKIYPEFTSDTNDSISYGKITSVLIQSIKELKTIIDNQQKQIEDLSNKLK